MTLYEQVQEYLQRKADSGINAVTLMAVLPPGWQHLGNVYCRAVTALGGWIDTLEVQQGILRVHSRLVPTNYTNMDVVSALKWLDDGVAKSSSQICMVSGKRGTRQKKAQGWPCLSTQLWIEYANEMPEKDWLP